MPEAKFKSNQTNFFDKGNSRKSDIDFVMLVLVTTLKPVSSERKQMEQKEIKNVQVETNVACLVKNMTGHILSSHILPISVNNF